MLFALIGTINLNQEWIRNVWKYYLNANGRNLSTQ